LLAEFLDAKIKQETTQAEFTKFPFHFAEISRVLLDGCVDASSFFLLLASPES
jgi:hypothetical protein